MSKLIMTNSPLYAKRIVREVNKTLRDGQSVYARAHPYNHKVSAAFEAGKDKAFVIYRTADGVFYRTDADGFITGAGQQVCASRTSR